MFKVQHAESKCQSDLYTGSIYSNKVLVKGVYSDNNFLSVVEKQKLFFYGLSRVGLVSYYQSRLLYGLVFCCVV